MSSEAVAAPEALLGLSTVALDERLRAFVEEIGERPYRARQIREWLWSKPVDRFADMSDLPKRVRAALEERFVLHPAALETRQLSRDGTEKYLWSIRGSAAARAGGNVESVLIPDGERVTYCISSQFGCAVKCPFCATGYSGFRGQLEPAAIVDQVLRMRSASGRAPTNIVYMGMGEPLLNFEAVSESIAILSHPDQVGLGARRLTVSTVCIPDRVRELARRHPQVGLAISLHAARDELRDELVPMNRKHPIAAVLDCIREVTAKTGRHATFEYVLLPEVNDSDRDADDLAALLGDLPARINLIGFNPFPEAPYAKPAVARLLRFQERVRRGFRGPVTLRRARGEDIQGACGQLAAR